MDTDLARTDDEDPHGRSILPDIRQERAQLVDGRAINSCLMLAVEADGCEIITIEGLAGEDRHDALQRAFLEVGAVQCGFCIPGMIMSARSGLIPGTGICVPAR